MFTTDIEICVIKVVTATLVTQNIHFCIKDLFKPVYNSVVFPTLASVLNIQQADTTD